MNSRPAKHGFHLTLFAMYKNTLSRCDLVINTTISFQVDQSFIGNIIHKPADLIHMRLYHHFKGLVGIDNAYTCTIRICVNIIYKRFYIIEPETLACVFKSDGGGSIDIISEKA